MNLASVVLNGIRPCHWGDARSWWVVSAIHRLRTTDIPISSTPRHIIVALWAIIVVVTGALLANNLKIDDDLTVFLPSDGSPVDDLLFARMRDGPAARLVLIAFQGGTAEDRVGASKAVANSLTTWDDLVRIVNGEQAMSPETFGALFDYRYLLSEQGNFNRASLEEALAAREEQLKSPFAKIYEKEASLDPTGVFRQRLVSWRDGAKPLPRDDGVWVSPDGSRSLVLVETTSPGYTLDRQVDTITRLEAALETIAAENQVEVVMSGAPISTVKARDVVRQELIVGTIIATLMVVAFLTWVYRSSSVLLLGALPIATGIMVGLAATLLVFGSVHRISLAFGITLLGVAIDYPLHLFSHTHRGERLAETAGRILPPMLLGAATTVAAFLVLGTGGFTGLAQLSVFISGGLIGAVATALWVLPSLVGDRRLFFGTKPARTQTWTVPGWSRFIVPILGIATILVMMTRADQIWERDLAALSPVPKYLKTLDGSLRADLGAPDLRYLFLISGVDIEAMLTTSEQLEGSLFNLKEDGVIGGFDALHRYVPSKAMQIERQSSLPEITKLEADLSGALEATDLDPAMFQPFTQSIATSRELPELSAEEVLAIFEDTPLWPKLLNLFVKREERWFGFVPLNAVQDLEALERTAAGIDGVDYIDLKEVSAESITTFRNQALIRLMIGIVVIFVLLLAVRKDVIVTLRIILAMVSALIVTAGMLFLLGEKFSLFHILASLVVIGVGLDYGLFFSWKTDFPDERRRAFHGIAICAVSTTIVFALLALSSISVLRVIGLTVALGTGITFISCYLIVAIPEEAAREDR